jgi:hypothetical protein
MADNKKIGIDTGTPGFDLDGKSYTYDVVPPGEPGVEPQTTSRGDMSVDHEVKDVSKTTLQTLGSYLGKSTKVNRYPVDGESTTAKLTTAAGVPSPLGDTQNTKRFTDRGSISDNVSLSVDPREELRGKVSKGKTSPQLTDGNELLPNAQTNAASKYVSAVLKNNRFTAAATSGPTDVSDPGAKYNPTLRHPKYGDVTTERLAQVGVTLSLRSSSELNSTDDGNNPTDGGTEAGALLPGFNQLGVKKVKTRVLEAQDVFEHLTSKAIPDATYLGIGDESWGTLNNVDDQFSGFQAIGMIGLSVALTAAVVVAFEGLSVIVGLVNPAPPLTHASNGRYLLGNAYLEKSSQIPGLPSGGGIGATLLGIRPTIKPLNEALKKGVEVFFNFSGGGIGSAITSGIKQSIASPGYNAVVARSIIRSSATIIETFKKAFSSANLVSGVKNVLNIIESIKRSKFIAAVNVFAALGDAELTDNENELIKGVDGEPMKKSRIDSIADETPGFAVMKHRYNAGKLKLTWASNTTPSMYLLPTRILGMSLATKLGGFQTGYGLQEARSRSKYKLIEGNDNSTKANRIAGSSDPGFDVESVEQALEAEYVPFYFHDLRTNEIVSFHAFISSLTESFTPGYESSEGLGRVDPVMIYKNTKRAINFKFHIVSTGLDDFNDMWVKINKLITLVYPQYTQGREISTDKYSFIQPFSQMMGASPMIRLRLGDLIRSNYSRFALARLFGVGSKETLKLDSVDVDFKIDKDKLQTIVNTLKLEGKPGWIVSSNGSAADTLSLGLPSFGVLGGTSEGYAPTFNASDDAQFLPVTIKKFLDDDTVIVVPSIIEPGDLKLYYNMSDSDVKQLRDRLRMTYQDGSIKNRVVGGQYVVSQESLRLSPMLHKTYADKLTDIIGGDALTKLADFMGTDNALVKSFESIKGKGLAGFITAMDFDWMDKVTWETIPGSKAPKMCTVSMTYAPIHDIAPGIDHTGFNRAPVYPVGWYQHGLDEKKEK